MEALRHRADVGHRRRAASALTSENISSEVADVLSKARAKAAPQPASDSSRATPSSAANAVTASAARRRALGAPKAFFSASPAPARAIDNGRPGRSASLDNAQAALPARICDAFVLVSPHIFTSGTTTAARATGAATTSNPAATSRAASSSRSSNAIAGSTAPALVTSSLKEVPWPPTSTKAPAAATLACKEAPFVRTSTRWGAAPSSSILAAARGSS